MPSQLYSLQLKNGVPLLVHVSTSGFVAMEKAAEIEQFFKDNPCPVADRIVKQNCEAIRLKCQWLERGSTAIEEWLKLQ